MRPFRIITTATAAVLLLLATPGLALAHGFGERYDLPVPLTLYVIGAGAAVGFSFLVIALFARGSVSSQPPRVNLFRWRWGRALGDARILFIVKLCSAVVFVTYLAAGLIGNADPNRNLVPTLTWVILWVGIVYASGFVGDVWALLNPWKIIYGWAEGAWARVTGKPLSRNARYPEELGVWPAVAFFMIFAWAENAWPNAGIPSHLVTLALGYTVITFAGMYVYGRDVWLRHGEAFSIAMGLFARFAPLEVRARDGAPGDYEAFAQAPAEEREVHLRPWGAGLLSGVPLSASGSVFLVLMLAAVSFDGFTETPPWARFLASAFDSFSWLGIHTYTGIKSLGLLLSLLTLFGAFSLAARLMQTLGRSQEPVTTLIGRFGISLVPIAFAYHIAHFFSFLLIQGQRIIPLASDPLGKGWNLLGTAEYAVDIGVVNARAAWIVGVAAIVLGHIAAVYAAHVIAKGTFDSPRLALRSQYPMMALMVGYTMLSLWIIAQPVVVD